jgi:hypothetical protein
MSKVSILILLLFFTSSLFAGDHNRLEDFDFNNPESMVGKLALSYYGQKKYFSGDDIRIIPTAFEIYRSNSGDIRISFSSPADGAASWYSREFKFNSTEKDYIFYTYKFGGKWQKLRFVFEENKINCFVKEGSIWGEDNKWLFVSDVVYLSTNYEP